MAAAAAVRWEGLSDFRRELRAIDRQSGGRAWSRELGRTHRELGTIVAGLGRARAESMGGQQAHFASAIAGRGTVTGARIGVGARAATAFWGAKGRSGWNLTLYQRHLAAGADGDGESTWGRQHPEWVGTTWSAGVAGQGPYAINDAIASNIGRIENTYGQMLDRVTRRAFPN